MKNFKSCPGPNNLGLFKIVDFGQFLSFFPMFKDNERR